MTVHRAKTPAELIGLRLLARRDAYAVHKRDGGYSRQTVDMNMSHLRSHITGKTDIGHYLIDPGEGITKLFAFDIDPDKGETRDKALAGDRDVWRHMILLGHGLAVASKRLCGTRSMVSYGGGKGLHVLCPFRHRVEPEEAIMAAEFILDKYGFEAARGANFWKSDMWPDFTIEVFPKQASVDEGGFGNLMRLPLGVNAATGNEGYFIPFEAEALGHMDDPIETLTSGTVR